MTKEVRKTKPPVGSVQQYRYDNWYDSSKNACDLSSDDTRPKSVDALVGFSSRTFNALIVRSPPYRAFISLQSLVYQAAAYIRQVERKPSK